MDADIEFLRESNNIENEWDDDSLIQAIYAWDFIVNQDILTINNILDTHKILMKNYNILETEKGFFRKRDVWIGGHKAKAPLQIDALIRVWVESANHTLKMTRGIEEQIIKDHIAYEAIHPFIDGNGRTGRIFLNWQRVRAKLPILVIKEKEKYEYYKWFN